MTEFVYATTHRPWMKGKRWRNAHFFTAPEADATRVYVVDNYPAIVEAYEAKKVPVYVLGPGAIPRVPAPLEPPPLISLDAAAFRRDTDG